MPSIFDILLNRQAAGPPMPGQPGPIFGQPSSNDPATASIFDDTPSARDTLMGLSRGLLAAGGPSPTPIGLGQALGQGLSGALAANEGLEDKRLKRALVTSQVQKAQSEISADKLLNDAFLGKSGPAATSPVSSVTPPVGAPTPLVPGAGGGGPSNPTNPGNLADGRGGFQTFKTPEDGVAGAIKLAQEFPKRYNGGQPMTLAQIEAHWSPPDDGRDPMTRGNKQGVWSGNVARAMGIDPNIPLDFNNPQIGLAFAKAVHQAEHPPGTGYQPDVYQRGASLAYGLPAFSTPGAATPTQAMLPPPSAVPAGMPAPAPGAIPPGSIAQPPVQLAGMPPQGDAAPAGGQQIAQAPPAPAAPKNLQDVINTMPPGIRQLAPGMTRQGKIELLMKYADPETRPAIDTTTGAVVFAPKNDNSGRYAPVDMMRLDIEKQNAESARRQAAAREANTASEVANRPFQPPAVPGGPGVPTQGYAEQQAVIEGAKKKAEQEALLDSDAGKTLVQTAVREFTEKERPKALAAQAQIPAIHNVRSQIEAGALTGSGTEMRNTLAQLASTMGFQSNEAKLTPAYLAALSNRILENAKVLGANPSNMEDKIISQASGANPDTSKEGVLRLLDVQESLLRQAQKRYNAEAGRIQTLRGVKSAYPEGYFNLPDSPTYADWKKENPVTQAIPDGSLAVPPMNAIDAEIARRRKAGAK